MKHKKILALLLIICLALAGCGKKTADTDNTDAGSESASTDIGGKKHNTHTDDNADKDDPQADSADNLYEIAPGVPDYPIEGSFASGEVIVFDGVSYISDTDGIYRIRDDEDEAERIIKLSMPEDAQFCTDGFMLYLADTDGRLLSFDLTENASKIELMPKGTVPEGSFVVSAGLNRLYIQTPETYDESGDFMDDLSGILVLDLESGEFIEEYGDYIGGAYGGYTYLMNIGYDFVPLELIVYGFEGSELIREAHCYDAYGSGGKLWYAVSKDENGAQDNITIYSLDGDEITEFYSEEFTDKYVMGFHAGGFLADISLWDDDDYADIYLDLRSGRIMPKEDLVLGNSGYIYWSDGITLKGDNWSKPKDFYVSSSQVAVLLERGLEAVYDVPSDMYAEVRLSNGHVIINEINGGFYVLPLDETSVYDFEHTISMTAKENFFYVTKGDLDVYTEYTRFGDDNGPEWFELSDALYNYNADTALLAAERADEWSKLSDDEEFEELFGDDKLVEADIRAYVKRADTKAFSFEQHRTVKLGSYGYGVEDIRTGYNFDTHDGHEIVLSEVVSDFDKFSELFTEHLMDVHNLERADAAEYVEEYLKLKDEPSCPETSWVLGYEGVTFYYNGDVNFPYSMQCGFFYVPFSEHPEIFNKTYNRRPQSYAYDIMLDMYYTEMFYLSTNDGVKELFAYPGYYDGEGGRPYVDELGYAVDLGDDNWEYNSVSLYSDTLRGMILHEWDEDGGKDYLLLQLDGDSCEIVICEFDEDKNEFVECADMPNCLLPQYDADFEDADLYDSEYYVYITHNYLSSPDLITVLVPDEDYPEYGYSKTEHYMIKGGKMW